MTKLSYKQTNCRLFGTNGQNKSGVLEYILDIQKIKLFSKNWFDKIAKVEEILENWKNCKLSLFGKVQNLITFVISQFVCQLHCLWFQMVLLNKLNHLYTNAYGDLDIELNS